MDKEKHIFYKSREEKYNLYNAKTGDIVSGWEHKEKLYREHTIWGMANCWQDKWWKYIQSRDNDLNRK